MFVALAALEPDTLTFDSEIAAAASGQADPPLRLLVSRGLLDDADAGRFRIHRALRDWAANADYRQVLAARRRLQSWHTTAARGDVAAPQPWHRDPDRWRQILGVWDEVAADDGELALLENCIDGIVPLLIRHGYWHEVVVGLERSLRRLRRLPTHQPLVARIHYLLGLVCLNLGRLEQAEQHAEAALERFQTQNDAPGQADAYSILALIDQSLGNLHAARASATSALEHTPQADRPRYAARLNDMGAVLRDQGDYAGARYHFEYALAVREKALGLGHPDTAASLSNLASLRYLQGDRAAARPLFEHALAVEERVLGPDHPDTANTLFNLAVIAFSEGNREQAATLMRRAHHIHELAFGPEHPVTANSRHALASITQAR
jgi:tetratricopeptide (TPR) repeat protein